MAAALRNDYHLRGQTPAAFRGWLRTRLYFLTGSRRALEKENSGLQGALKRDETTRRLTLLILAVPL